MKRAFILLALLAATAQAGTVYRDRPFPVPSGTPCFVLFDGTHVNAAMVSFINVGPRAWSKYEGFSSGYVVQPPYQSLRVTYITGAYFEIRTGDLKAQEAALLKTIRECK